MGDERRQPRGEGRRGDDEQGRQDPFVERVAPDPSEPAQRTVNLRGLLGKSDREGFQRVYSSTDLDYFAEFKTEDVVFTEPIAPDQPPFMGLDSTILNRWGERVLRKIVFSRAVSRRSLRSVAGFNENAQHHGGETMSGISRRSLLGYSGTTAAGAVLASAGSAQAADAEEKKGKDAGGTGVEESVGAQAAASFPAGTEFKGRTAVPGVGGELVITFSVAMMDAPASHDVPAIDIANALTKLAEDHGWSPITFYGTPAPAPLTS
ncbi:hypothetical protein ACZ90_11195 [Streptomyces albus subsp. albus]|nr:hypothetical protein ACZ90_11195 [Streptomyces albus subsp. albus]